jgi:hypothetical protein
MPKLITYQRPAPVSKQNWNHAPGRKADAPRKAPGTEKPETPMPSPLLLQQLLRKS